MPATILKNITINERQSISGETYFIIKDQDTEQVYFCFQNKLKTGWTELMSSQGQIKEIEIEYEENERGNKVINLDISREGEFII